MNLTNTQNPGSKINFESLFLIFSSKNTAVFLLAK